MRFLICVLTFVFTHADISYRNSTDRDNTYSYRNTSHMSDLYRMTAVSYVMNLASTTNNINATDHKSAPECGVTQGDAVQCKATRAGVTYSLYGQYVTFIHRSAVPAMVNI